MKVLSVIVLLIVTGVDCRTFSNSHCADFKTAVEGKPDKYIEIVHMMPKERDCPPGTHFEQRTCECSLLLLDTHMGTTVHGGVGNNMHHDPPGLQGTTGRDAGIPNEFAHLPTKVLVELLNQEQAKSQQRQDYIPQPTVTTVTPGIRAIHTKKGSHGVFSDLQQSGGSSQPLHLSSSGSWRRGQPNSKSNKVHKQKQGRRPAPVESGGIPIPSNFMTDRSRILNRIEKKPKKKNNLGLLRRQTGTRTIHPGVHQSSMHTSAHKSLGVMNEAKMPIVDVQSPLPNAMSPSDSALDKHTLGVAAATEAVNRLDAQIANLLKTMNEGRKLADSPIKSKSVTKSKTITASDQLSSGSDLSHLGIGTSSGSTTDLLHLGIGRPELKPRLVENKPVRPTNMETEIQKKIPVSPIQQTGTMPSNVDLTKISGQLSSGTQPSSTQNAGGTTSSDNTGRSKSSDSGSSSNIDVNGLLNMVKFALNQPSHSVKSSPLMGQIQQLLASQTTASGQSVESPLMSQIKQVLGTISQGQGQPQVQGNTNNLLNQFLAKISPATTSTNGGSGNTLSSLLNSMTSSGGMTMNMPQQNPGMLPMTSSGMPFNLELMQSSGMPFNMGTPAGQMSMLQSVLQNEGGGDAAEMARGMGLGGGGGEGMGSLGGMFTGGMGFGGMGGLGGGMGLFGS